LTWEPTWFAFLLLIAALFLAFFRLVRGPSLPDRVVALDLIATLAVGFTAIYAMATDEPTLVDVSILLALISFLGTVAFALYVGRRGAP
jgi:multicomponent Na+:H+ antiporter subunit F